MFEKTKAFFKNVKEKLSKTSDSLTSSITEVFKVRVKVDEKVLENLQENLILSDVSYSSSEKIISNFRNTIKNIESEQEVTEGFYLSFLQKGFSCKRMLLLCHLEKNMALALSVH